MRRLPRGSPATAGLGLWNYRAIDLCTLRIADCERAAGAAVAMAETATGARGPSAHSRARARAGTQVDAESCGRVTELQRRDSDAAPDFFGQQQFWPGKDRRQNG